MRGTRSKVAFEIFREGVRARALPLTRARWQQSDQFFRDAIAKDTGLTFEDALAKRCGFPRAWSWMAYGVALSFFEGWQGPKAIDDAIAYVDLSIELDEFDYENHWVAAFVHLLAGNIGKVDHHMQEALYLNEEDLNMSLLNEMADILVWLGRTDEAIKLLERARRTPDWNRWSMAWCYYFKGKQNPAFYDKALDELSRCFWKPGQEEYEHDMQLLVAAINAQKESLAHANNDPQKAAEYRKNVDDGMKNFSNGKQAWSILDEMRRMPFADTPEGRAQRDHWRDGLQKIPL